MKKSILFVLLSVFALTSFSQVEKINEKHIFCLMQFHHKVVFHLKVMIV